MSKHSEAVIRSQRKHRERFNAYQREYWKRPENRAKKREWERAQAARYKRETAYERAIKRDSRLTKKETAAREKVRQAERLRRWKVANPERAAELARRVTMRYAARKHGAEGHATPEQIRQRWLYYGNRCWMCGDQATQTDHVIPLNRGGSDWPSNQRPACGPCNRRKGDRLTLGVLTSVAS